MRLRARPARHRRATLTGAIAGALVGGVLLGGCTANSVPTSPGVAPGTPVAAPSGGNITETVAPSETPKIIKTDIPGSATPADGLSVRIDKVEAIDAKAQGPGEVSGPAVAVTVTIRNTTAKDFDLGLFAINLEDSKGLPGAGMVGPPASWLSKSVAAGAKATGVYVFSVPAKNRQPIRVSVSANPGLPTVVFEGNV